jgi:homocitrate synthase NifV
METMAVAQAAGARRSWVADTLSVLDPFAAFDLIAKCARRALEIEIHCHDDLGLPPQIFWRASRQARRMLRLPMGLGERAGNAPLEEVAVAASVTQI